MVGIVLYLEYLEQNDFSKKESKNSEQNLRTLFEKYVPAAIIKRYLDSEEVTKLFHTFPIVMSQDVWKALALHPHYSFITSLGKQKIRGKEQELEAFGFNSSIKSTPPRVQTVGDFLPLQGVGEKCSI